MARPAQTNSLATRPVGNEDDRCPHCSSTRYMNKNLKLLTNSVCYHKLCETCVDRLFGTGPRPCPYAGCGRTIRRVQFRAPTFEDLKIEREVDIRRRVANIFNRREEEFTDLKSWNDYLENVETMTFNLIYGTDVEKTEAQLASYAKQNAESIKRNKQLEEHARSGLYASLKADKESRNLARQESMQEEEEHRQERITRDTEAQDRIRRGVDPKGALKKDIMRKKAGPASKAKDVAAASVDNGAPIFEIQGLKPVAAPVTKKAFDPFGGYAIKPKYFTPKKTYEHQWAERARNDPKVLVGGYDVDEWCARTMLEAFSGLGVFIDEDAERREPKHLANVARTLAAT